MTTQDVLVLVMGLVFGSFANVLIARLPGGESVGGRSRCPKCGHELGVLDLVPVLSWLWLAARCRYCRTSISARYPAVELAVAGAFVATWRAAGPGLMPAALHLVYALAMIVILVTDFERAIIPNVVVLPAAALALIAVIFRLDPTAPSALAGLATAVVGAGLFLVLFLVSGGAGMGMGDVKLMLFLGLVLGPLKVLLAVLSGSIVALALAAVILVFFRRRLGELRSVSVSLDDDEEPEIEDRFLGVMIINGKPAVPLGTFLALGYFFAYFWGDAAIRIWLGF